MNDNSSTSSAPASAIDFHQELAAEWEQKYEKQIFAQRAAKLKSVIAKYTKPNETWIDAGCGTGTLARALVELGVTVTGFDGSSAMVEVSTKQSSKEISEGKASFQLVETIEELPLEDHSIDGIVCSSVVEYLDDPSRCLREFNRVLKDGGSLVMTVPHRRSMISVIQRTVFFGTGLTGNPRPTYLKYSKNRYSSGQLKRLMTDHGFSDETIDFTSYWPKWLPYKMFGAMCLYHGRKTNRSNSSA